MKQHRLLSSLLLLPPSLVRCSPLLLLLVVVAVAAVTGQEQVCETFYTITFRANHYYLSTFNVETRKNVEIGIIGGRDLDPARSLTIDPTTGKLYGLVNSTDWDVVLVEISKSTGAILSAMPTGIIGRRGGNGIAVNSRGRMMIAQEVKNGYGKMYDVDATTGESTFFGRFDPSVVTDLAFDPNDELYYLGYFLGTIDLDRLRDGTHKGRSFYLEDRDKHTPPDNFYGLNGFDFVSPRNVYVVPGLASGGKSNPFAAPPIFPLQELDNGRVKVKVPTPSKLMYPIGCAFECQ